MTTLPNNSVNPSPIFWKGASGRLYEFHHYAINGVVWNEVGGVYIFCKAGDPNLWQSVYVGQSDNFRRRLADEFASHHRRDDISRHGATHVCGLVVTDEAERLRIELDLIHGLNPPCNRT